GGCGGGCGGCGCGGCGWGSSTFTLTLNNNLIERCSFSLSRGYYVPTTFAVNYYNNLVRFGSHSLAYYINPDDTEYTLYSWVFYDNLFDHVALSVSGSSAQPDLFNWMDYVLSSHNGYVSTTTITGSAGSDKTPTTADYQVGPLGNYYYPTNGGNLSQLIDTGSRSAASAQLYHFTTTTNQVKEGSSTVDIGFHYVALSQGQPVDTDGDGLADYFEDTNGNGSYATGDLSNWQSADTDGDGVNDYIEWIEGRNPRVAGTTGDSGVINLRLHTPFK